MLHIWDAIEADFLRDYRIVLMEQIESMTWRYFLVLLNNLSPYGAVAMRIRAANDKPENSESGSNDDEKDANQFFSSLLSV